MIATRRIRPPSHDPNPPFNLERGDVTQCGREQVGIVAGCSRDRVLLWPVRWGIAERATDIPVTGWLDSTVLGNPRQAMVQVGTLLDASLSGQRRLGRITSSLLLKIEAAAARHNETERLTRRWNGSAR
jgi:hypothetical protein